MSARFDDPTLAIDSYLIGWMLDNKVTLEREGRQPVAPTAMEQTRQTPKEIGVKYRVRGFRKFGGVDACVSNADRRVGSSCRISIHKTWIFLSEMRFDGRLKLPGERALNSIY